MPQLDSLYRMKSGLWGPYYAAMEQQLGITATLVNFGNQQGAGLVTATTWTGRKFNSSGLSPTWTPSEALSAFDTPFDLKLESNWQGLAPVLRFNGTDEEADTPDATYWSRGDGTTDSAFSVGVWANITDSILGRSFLSKYDATTGSEAREWVFQLGGDDKLYLYLIDETANILINRGSDAVIPAASWQFLVAVYAGTAGGSGGTAANNITLYRQGAVEASTATNNASYDMMDNTATVVGLGYYKDTAANASFYNGALLGGPWSPFFVQAALTAAQVANLYDNMRLGLGV